MFNFLHHKNRQESVGNIEDGESLQIKSRMVVDIIPKGSKIVLTARKKVEEKPQKQPLAPVDERQKGDILPHSTTPRPKEEALDQADRFFKKSSESTPDIRKTLYFLSGLFIVGLLFILLTTLFAGFTVFVNSKAELVNIPESKILVATKFSGISAADQAIPGEILELSKDFSRQFSATAKKNISERAKGIIKIYNSFSSLPQVLVAGTRFAADSGKIFRLNKAVVVPGATVENGGKTAQFIEAEVSADVAGNDYNIGPSKFRIPGFQDTPKYKEFYGESEVAFTGGFEGEAIVMSAEDLKKATEKVTSELFNAIRNELPKKIPADTRLLDGLKEIEVESVSAPKEGTVGGSFNIKASGRARSLVFREKDLEELLKQSAAVGLSKEKNFNGSFSLSFKKIDVDFEEGTASFVVSGTAGVKWKIDGEKIKGSLAGKRLAAAESFLRNEESIASFRFKVFPFWKFTVPSDIRKIDIVINH